MLPDMPVSFQSQPRCKAPGDTITFLYKSNVCWFQSQPRCQAPGDTITFLYKSNVCWFQSQPRCQAPGDSSIRSLPTLFAAVSISTEMPGPWRLGYYSSHMASFTGFNLNRDARPLATNTKVLLRSHLQCFNLNRDARPLATSPTSHCYIIGITFQSQPRCQAPGDSTQ